MSSLWKNRIDQKFNLEERVDQIVRAMFVWPNAVDRV